jgi:hypothetical protein
MKYSIKLKGAKMIFNTSKARNPQTLVCGMNRVIFFSRLIHLLMDRNSHFVSEDTVFPVATIKWITSVQHELYTILLIY